MTNNNNFNDESFINCCLNEDVANQAINNIVKDCVAAAKDQIYNKRQLKDFEDDIQESVQTKKLYMRLYNPRYKLSSRLNALRSKLMKVHVNNHIQREYMANLFNCEVILNKVPNTHPHMCLAQIRRQYEFIVTLGMAPLKIFDIGAGCRSIKYGLTNVFNNQPVLSAADKMRSTKRRQAVAVDPFMSKFVCDCKVQQCKHIELPEQKGPECFDADLLLSIDSSYYDGVLDFIETYLKSYPDKAAYLAFHVFDLNTKNGAISVCGNVEGQFEIYGNKVRMTVNGNPCAYTHNIHPLNELYQRATIQRNGIYYAVEKSADFGSSKYLLVHAVYIGEELEGEFPNDTDTLHKKIKPRTKSQGTEVENKQPELPFKTINTIDITANFDTSLLLAGYYYKIQNEKTTDVYKVESGTLKAVTLINDDLERVNLDSVHFEVVMSMTDLSKIVTKLLLKKGEITYTDVVNAYVALTAGRPLDLKYVTAIIVKAAASAKKVCESAAQVLNSEDIQQINQFKSNDYRIYRGYWQIVKQIFCNLSNKLYYYAFPLLSMLVLVTIASLATVYFAHNYQSIINYIASCFGFQHIFVTANPLDVIYENPGTFIIEFLLWLVIFKFIRLFCSFKNSVQPLRRIKTSCISKDNYKEVSQPLMDAFYKGHPTVTWNHKIAANLTLDDFLKHQCDCIDKDGLVQLVPGIYGAEEPIIYHVCEATNYCAAKRQVSVVPKPDQDMLKSFEDWFGLVFEKEIKPLLDGLDPDVGKWLNHLSYKKQKQVATIHEVFDSMRGESAESIDHYFSLIDINTKTDYEMFVKSEKQLYSGGKAPKNRCICSPNAYCKYVMGPVTWALEHQFAHFPGYCGGASWSDLENDYKRWADFGFSTTIQLDGSGFDRTQHQEIKNIVDQTIYKYVAERVTHVPKETFLRIALAEERKVKVTHRIKLDKQRVITDGVFKQIGAVFSGSCDTTLMNTLRMACYNRFVCERLTGLSWGQYEVKSKGDDTVTIIQPNVNLSALMKAYNSVFVYGMSDSEYVGLKHGLGQIAKYFKIGTIEDIDFCSTETMYCPSIDAYKIMRQVKRFVTTSVYSRKACHFNSTQMAVYLRAFYESNLSWMKGIPIFRAFNRLFYRNVTGLVIQTKTGKTRRMFDTDVLQDIDRDYYFESDHHYSLHDHISFVKPTEQDCLEYFARKYQWSASDVYAIEKAILQNNGEYIDCPLLEEITH